MNRLVTKLSLPVVLCLAACTGVWADPVGLSPEGGDRLELETGLPLGGVGAGYIELMEDGTTGRLVVTNNWDRPVTDSQGLAWAVAVSDGKRVLGCALRGRSGPGRGVAVSERAMQTLRFRGRFPQARLDYSDPDIPVDICLRAWTPFVPHDLDATSTPLAAFVFDVTNNAEAPRTVTLAGSWEHIIGLGIAEDRDEGPTAESDDASPQVDSAPGVRIGNQVRIEQETRRYALRFDTTRHSPSGRRLNAIGEHLLAVETEKGDIVTGLLGFDPARPEVFWSDLDDDGRLRPWETLSVITPASSRAESNSALAVTFQLKPGATRHLRFVLAWHMPHLVTRQGDLGTDYVDRTEDAWGTALRHFSQFDQRWEQTWEWQRLLDDSTLPDWLKDAFCNSLQVLVTNTVHERHGAFGMLESAEGTGLGSLLSRLFYQPGLLMFFPELDAKELRTIRNLQFSTGQVPCLIGDLREAIGAADVPGGLSGSADNGSAFVIQLQRHVAATGDRAVLRDAYDGARAAIGWCQEQDTNGDGIPSGSALYEEMPPPNISAASVGLWLAALRAAKEMAEWSNDQPVLSDLKKLQWRVERSLLSVLWNGDYFGLAYDPRRPADDSRKLILTTQLLQQWLGGSSRMEPILSADIRRRILGTLAAVSEGEIAVPPLVVVPGGEGERTGDVWPYHQIAGLAVPLIYDGYERDGYSLLRRLAESAEQTPLGVWGAPRRCTVDLEETRAIRASESLVMTTLPAALAGFSLDLTEGEICIDPKLLNRDEIVYPVFTPRGWFELRARKGELGTTRFAALRVIRLFGDEPFELERLGWKLPEWVASDAVDLVVETSRDRAGITTVEPGLALCLFPDGFRLREGDEFRMTLVPDLGPYLLVDCERRTTELRGAAVRKLPLRGLGADRFGFQLFNLLDTPQPVRLRFSNTSGEVLHLVYDGGESPIAVAEEMSVVIDVPASPLSGEAEDRWRRTSKALNRLLSQLGEFPTEKTIAKRVVQLRSDLDELLAQDLYGRRQRFLLSQELEAADLETAPDAWSPSDFQKAQSSLESDIESLFRDADRLTLDPHLSAMTLGAVLPVELQVEVLDDETWRGGEAHVRVSVRSHAHAVVDGRVDLQFPQGWSAQADGTLQLAHSGIPGTIWRRDFTVQPDGPANSGRQTLTVDVNAQWRAFGGGRSGKKSGRYFHLTESFALGSGFARDWYVLGPFPNVAGTGFSTFHDPEGDVNVEQQVKGKSWLPYRSSDGYVDLAGFLTPNEGVLAYAYAYVNSPRVFTSAILHLGGDDGVKVFVNGREIYAYERRDGIRVGEFSVPLDLRRGRNAILLKITQSTGLWGFYAEITDRQGLPIDGMTWGLDQPKQDVSGPE